MSLNKCNEQSHIGYVINRLMINLKSCFLFDLSSDLGTNTGNNTIEELLRIGVKIGQIPNTQGMKKSTLKREKN